MNFKKIVSLTAIAALCITLLSGCYAPEDQTSSYYEMSVDTTSSQVVTSTLPTSKFTATATVSSSAWAIIETEGTLLNVTNGTSSVLIIKLAELAEGTLVEGLAAMKTHIDEIYTNVTYTDEGSDTTIGGYAAKRVDFVGDHRGLYSGKSDEISIANQTNSFFAIVIDKELYIVKSNVPTVNIEADKATVEAIFKSIQFTAVA